MLNVILARHAETIWNEQMRYIGRTDLDLSKLGQSNARLLAGHLRDAHVKEIFSSKMRRAVQTAEAVAVNHGSKVNQQSLLNEIDFGVWEGLTYDEIVRSYPEIAEKWSTNPYSINIPAGEQWPVFTERVLSGWNEIIEMAAAEQADDEKTVLIVTHAGCIKIILAEILGISKERAWRIYQNKGALNHLTVAGQQVKVQRINNTDYRKEAAGLAAPPDDEIRPCSKEDKFEVRFVINKAAAGYSTFLGVDYDADDYMSTDELSREIKKMTFYAIVRGGLIVAVMAYQPLKDVVLLRHAYVLPACRRQGLARRLLGHAERMAQRDGFNRVLVGAYRENSGAIAFYQKQGYSLTEYSDELLDKYWDISEAQAEISVVLCKESN
ncbi:MAG TPA: GNAT family N-acetyltransferase [Actinobacteria bacterium]|nr:GNAT family N-acetyltransferase [Actinomycetota bacterium]